MPISDLKELLRSMAPSLNDGVYCFVVAPSTVEIASLNPIATFVEREGLSLIVEESAAMSHRMTPLFRAAWITLTVHSDLSAIGLTAAVSAALTDAGISCNVVAGAHHDHLFVPIDKADAAMRTLTKLTSL
jgi:hypothetical protein